MEEQETSIFASTATKLQATSEHLSSSRPGSFSCDAETSAPTEEVLECVSRHLAENCPDAPKLESGLRDDRGVERTVGTSIYGTSLNDPHIVNWESADTPYKATNWSIKKKWSNVAIISIVTFLTPLASTIVAPGVPQTLHTFKNSNETVGSLIVSIYLLGYAIGPLFLAPLSEVYGRLPLLNICTAFFVVWSVACALAPDVGSLLVFRTLAGVAGACPLAVGGGSIADLFEQEERGLAMSLFISGPLVGPVVGPVVGGFLAEYEGWRWTEWTVAIAAAVILALSLLLLRETYEPVILQRRVDRLRKETGNQTLRSALDPGISSRQLFTRAIVRPLKMLLSSPTVLLVSIYMAIVFGYLYLLFATFTLVFQNQYGFSERTVGLSYLGVGVGSLAGLCVFAAVSDRTMKIFARGGKMKAEYRLFPWILGSLFIPAGLFWYGWSAQKALPWIMPIVGTGWVGLGMVATFMSIQTYLVDAFQRQAASALAANMALRSLAGAFLPLAGPRMYAALGLGWGNSLLGFLALAMAPFSWLFFRHGEKIRARSAIM